MDRSDTTPTLLVFTLGPECERSRRRLLPAPLRQAEILLHQHGLARALEAGRASGMRIVVSSPEPLDLPAQVELHRQQGCTFAERLLDAIASVQGTLDGSPLVVVGTDTPDLDVEHLRAATLLVEREPSSVVVGPSLDGGFYLLAGRVDLAATLTDVRWCRPDTLRTLVTALRNSGHIVQKLSPLRDLDRTTDVERWLARPGGSAFDRLRRYLLALLATWRRPRTHDPVALPRLFFVSGLSGRGPPL